MIPKYMKNWVTKTIFVIFLILFASVAQAKTIMIYGDSLSAGYGIDLDKSWVTLLNQALEKDHSVINASISGETTSGGLSRLPVTLEEINPDIVVLELGGNDGLGGLPIKRIHANLEQMIIQIQESGAQLIVAGISLPPSYGARYIDQFRAVFTDLAQAYTVPYLDFFDEELFLKEGYIQNDGIHPTELAQPIIRDRILDFLKQQKVVD